MLSSNFDFKESFQFFSSAVDYNMKRRLQKIQYQFPVNESITEEPKIENELFNKALLFDDDYPSTFLTSISKERANSISTDENKDQHFEIKKENKIKYMKNSKNLIHQILIKIQLMLKLKPH